MNKTDTTLCTSTQVRIRKKRWMPKRCKVCHYRACRCFCELEEDMYFSSKNNSHTHTVLTHSSIRRLPSFPIDEKDEDMNAEDMDAENDSKPLIPASDSRLQPRVNANPEPQNLDPVHGANYGANSRSSGVFFTLILSLFNRIKNSYTFGIFRDTMRFSFRVVRVLLRVIFRIGLLFFLFA